MVIRGVVANNNDALNSFFSVGIEIGGSDENKILGSVLLQNTTTNENLDDGVAVLGVVGDVTAKAIRSRRNGLDGFYLESIEGDIIVSNDTRLLDNFDNGLNHRQSLCDMAL